MKLVSQRIHIRPLAIEDAEDLLDLRMMNREFLRPFEPVQTEAHFTLNVQREIIAKLYHDWEQGLAYGFGIFRNDTNQLIGRLNLSNVVRGQSPLHSRYREIRILVRRACQVLSTY